MSDKQQEKYVRMTTQPVGRLVRELAVPTIISMMVTAAYNMVDTFFVGQLHSNSATGDTEITATFHHNWFEGSSSRHPRVRYGKVHVYNNLFDANTTYGVGSAYGAKVLVEFNYFDNVQLPTDICTYPAKDNGNSNLEGSVAGFLYATNDVFVNRPSKAKDPYPLTNFKYNSNNGSTITPLTYDGSLAR